MSVQGLYLAVLPSKSGPFENWRVVDRKWLRTGVHCLELICLPGANLLPKYGKKTTAVLAAISAGCSEPSNGPFALPSELEQAAGLDVDMVCSSCWESWQKISLQGLEPPVDDQQDHSLHQELPLDRKMHDILHLYNFVESKIKGSVAPFVLEPLWSRWPKHWLGAMWRVDTYAQWQRYNFALPRFALSWTKCELQYAIWHSWFTAKVCLFQGYSACKLLVKMTYFSVQTFRSSRAMLP